MERPTCPLCKRWISEWAVAGGKTITLVGQTIHIACALDHDLSVAELEALVRRSA